MKLPNIPATTRKLFAKVDGENLVFSSAHRDLIGSGAGGVAILLLSL